MVITLELPVRRVPPTHHANDPLAAYVARFGALPPWLEELTAPTARALAHGALRRGEPLTPADYLS